MQKRLANATWLLLTQLLSSSCVLAEGQQPNTHNLAIGFEIVLQYPHRPDAFTQGLLVLNTTQARSGNTAASDTLTLIEGTGHKGQSSISRITLGPDINVQQEHKLDKHLFGEGVAQFNDKLYQLTWQAGLCLVYQAQTLAPIETKQFQGQGWGLTASNTHLIMSDGSARLQFRDPHTFDITNTLVVNDRGRPVKALNELEWVNGLIYANIWYSDWIVAIDDKTGRIQHRIDLSSLRQQQPSGADVLNGIAYNANTDTFLVTGKYWSTIYEIKLVDKPAQR